MMKQICTSHCYQQDANFVPRKEIGKKLTQFDDNFYAKM